MAEFFEVIMIVSFGFSWPFNVVRSYKARTTKGKSLSFLLLIMFGYVAGIISKFLNAEYMLHITERFYVLFFYILNLVMVAADFLLYLRNKRLDRLSEQK